MASQNYPVEFPTGNIALLPETRSRQSYGMNDSGMLAGFYPAKKGGCGCNGGGGISSLIQDNPVLFLVGALAAGYFLAKQK